MTEPSDNEIMRYYGVVDNTDHGYLKMEELKEGWSYQIFARNAHTGIWMKDLKGFLILRHKRDLDYLFIEYHWDTGHPHGTVKPFFEIEKTPFEPDKLTDDCEKPIYSQIFEYLCVLNERFPFGKTIKAYWEHCERTQNTAGTE